MRQTAYYSDQDFERFMARSLRERKVQFYVWLGCSFVIQPAIYAIIFSDDSLSLGSKVFLIVLSVVAFICLIGLWYCYRRTKRSIDEFHQMRQEQQEEMNALLDEVEQTRKLNRNW